jgi:bacteriochlorophyll 4-vinyl reductase
MPSIPKSGFYYANKLPRITLQAYEVVLGKNGLNAILNLAGLRNLIDNFPPDNLERQFDFADFSAFHIALEDVYGSRGGHGLALRAGRATFDPALINPETLAGVGGLPFKELPVQTRIGIFLPAAAAAYSQITDMQSGLIETEAAFIWTIQRCPICWSRQGAEKPVCDLHTGLLKAMLTWVSTGLEYQVQETKCCAMGDPVCEFVINKEPIL